MKYYWVLFVMVAAPVLKAGEMESLDPAQYTAAENFESPQLSSSSEQDKEKLVMVHFWATWCPPCIAELPDLLELAQIMQEELAVVIIAVSSSREKQEYYLDKIFMEHGEPSGNVTFMEESNSTVDRLFRTQGVPVSYLFDREGRFFLKAVGRQHWLGTKGSFVPNWWPFGETWKEFLSECWLESEDCPRNPSGGETARFQLAGFSLQFNNFHN